MFEGVAAKMAENEPVLVQDAPVIPGRTVHIDGDAPVIPGRTVHIDGDALAYKASGPDGTDAGTSRIIALNLIKKAQRRAQAEKAVVHITSDGCHKGQRYLAATVKPYQAKRAGSRKPQNWAYLREFLCLYEGTDFVKKVWATREADDGIAACCHYAVAQGRLDAIHADDKDMRMLPGVHVSWRDDQCITEVGPDDYEVIGKDGKVYGKKWFWLQMLHGDDADNIPGLEFTWLQTVAGKEPRMCKVGPATAEKLLFGTETASEAMDIVLAHYERGYRGQGLAFAHDRFVEQAVLLWLRRSPQAVLDDALVHMPYENTAVTAAFARLVQRVQDAENALKELQE